MDHTFALSGPINLSARLGHGSLEIRAVDGVTAAVVEVHGGDEALARMTVELAGATLTVHGPRQGGLADLFALGRGHKSESIHATITVPTGTAMRVATFTAPVTVEGCTGGADITSGAGNITLDDVDGDLALRFGSATAKVRSVTGSVTVRSGAGSAEFGEVGGDLEAGCGRGTLTVGTVRGSSRSRSGAGEASLGAVYGDVDLASGSGAMSIGLPSGVTARLDVMTGAGRVRSDLPVSEQPTERSGAITVRARTGNGDVRLFRAA